MRESSKRLGQNHPKVFWSSLLELSEDAIEKVANHVHTKACHSRLSTLVTVVH
jgi:hypothetical protein